MPNKHTTKLANKRVLVVGGTSGIGFAVAEHLLELGAMVIVASSPPRYHDRPLDANPDTNLEPALIQLLEFATENKTHLLDHIVMTAGEFITTTPLSELECPASSFLTSQRTRVLAPIVIAKLAKTYMHISPRSSLTVTGGANTYRPSPSWYFQAAIGGSLEALARSLAVELQPIRVNQIAPGPVWTEIFAGLAGGSEQAEKELRESFAGKVLTGQMADAADCAEAYVYVIRDASVTGQTIYNESGYLLKFS